MIELFEKTVNGLCRSLFLICNFIKKETLTQVVNIFAKNTIIDVWRVLNTPSETDRYSQVFNRILANLQVKISVMRSFFSTVTVLRFSALLKRDSVTVVYQRISINFIKTAKLPIFLRSFWWYYLTWTNFQ